VDSIGCVTLSEVDAYDGIRGVKWRGGATMEWFKQEFPQPVVAFEDC